MKANNAFRMEEEAVSPVIGVILMVAITVVLAAVVFVLVSDLGGSNDSAPAMAFSKDEARDRVEVTSAASGADWARISAKVVSCTQEEIPIAPGNPTTGAEIVMGASSVHVNTAAAATGSALNTVDSTAATAAPTDGATACGAALTVAVTSTVTSVVAGDFLEFCNASTGATGADATLINVQLIDTTANSKIWEGQFSNIADC